MQHLWRRTLSSGLFTAVIALTLALVQPSCGGVGTFLRLSLSGALAGELHDIALTLTMNGKAANATLGGASSSKITLPTTAVLDIRSGEGTLEVRAEAHDSSGALIGRAMGEVLIERGRNADLSLLFTESSPPSDLGAEDLAPPDLTPPCPIGQTLCPSGCATLSSDINNCGACGVACTNAHGTTSCSSGVCMPVCAGVGWADCLNLSPNADGCETNTITDAAHCGACSVNNNRNCNQGATGGTCSSGVCSGAVCSVGRANCDGNAANGCEVDTNTNAAHCAGCNTSNNHNCNRNASGGTCTGGVCSGATCNHGFCDNDGNGLNGCEYTIPGSDGNCCSGCSGLTCVSCNTAGGYTCQPSGIGYDCQLPF